MSCLFNPHHGSHVPFFTFIFFDREANELGAENANRIALRPQPIRAKDIILSLLKIIKTPQLPSTEVW